MSEHAEVCSVNAAGPDAIDRQIERFDRALEALAESTAVGRPLRQNECFQVAETLMHSDRGMRALAERAHRFDDAGVFTGGPWAHPDRLLPPLVEGGLKAPGVERVVETLSELRILAIALERSISRALEADEARRFLDEVMALNLEFIFPGDGEVERIEGGPHRDSAIRLFRVLAEDLGLGSLRWEVVREIEQIAAQRPIMTERILRHLEIAGRIPEHDPGADPGDEVRDRLDVFLRAVHGPTTMSADAGPTAYRRALRDAGAAALGREADGFRRSMRDTGLICPQHAVFLRHVRTDMPDLLARALDLNDAGRAELNRHHELVAGVIGAAIRPATAQAVYGLARCLERSLLSRQDVETGLRRIVRLDIREEVGANLLARRDRRESISPNAVLAAGVLSVLGQPLGVGQGRNPTCQAARAISLWSEHAPGYLLSLIISAARDGLIEMAFEGATIRSDVLTGGLAPKLDLELDPVSIVLVPHLDRMYDEMMKRVVLRAEDGHKWVNPALYGRWVPTGFASVFMDIAQTTVANYADFQRRFFVTHHPAHNGGHQRMYPNPVGLCITSSHGAYLGPHAVSLLRVNEDADGRLRAYFFNPNNEGRQDWGYGVKPSIREHGEREGESSLPFEEFAARLYAFHYNPNEERDLDAVDAGEIERIERAARESWGKAFKWLG
ncbi:MAG: hypothetical protein ACF8QF_08940 [Phycisphaerales bacterium]